jgi:hypothetical protein
VNYIENRYSEFWGMRKDSSGQWVAVWGGSEPFDAFTYPDGLRVWPTSEHFYGTAASGIAMVPGLILLDDLKQNYIDHPVMFSVPNACQHYKPPATREDGMGGADCIQYGAKIKLPASINVDAIRSDSRWCAPGPSHYNDAVAGSRGPRRSPQPRPRRRPVDPGLLRRPGPRASRPAVHPHRGAGPVPALALRADREGKWRYPRGSQLMRPQKWGKGPLVAAICCAEAAGPVLFDGWDAKGEPVGRPWATPHIQVTAGSEDQTANTWRALQPMIELGPLGDSFIPTPG